MRDILCFIFFISLFLKKKFKLFSSHERRKGKYPVGAVLTKSPSLGLRCIFFIETVTVGNNYVYMRTAHCTPSQFETSEELFMDSAYVIQQCEKIHSKFIRIHFLT